MKASIYNQMLSAIRERYPNYAELWVSTRKEFGEAWEAEFNISMSAIFGYEPETWNEAIDGYAEFCTDALRSQIYFERNGHYKASSYEMVAKQCYHNPNFMFRCYLPGMLLSHFIWPHHHRMLRYYRSLVSTLDGIQSFSEVGTGCGIYSKETLALLKDVRGIGYDISKHSLSFTERVISSFGLDKRYRAIVQDITIQSPEPVDLVICQEVLEHLENPAEFTRALFTMTKPGGYSYISVAINAGHVDHIYLYRNPDEVMEHICKAGFRIISSRAEYAYGGKPLNITPCHGAFLCHRAL